MATKPLNAQRVNKAAVALSAFSVATFEKELPDLSDVELKDALTDLISYAMHYAASAGFDGEALAATALEDFRAGMAGELG